jgi:uncharacterized protein (TIGR02118 family)
MIKMVYCVRKHPDLSDEEFRRYWLVEHGPLVRSFAELMRAKRYVQSHTLDTELNEAARGPRGSGEPYDGITEIWWESVEDLVEALQDPACQEANMKLSEDEGRFVDKVKSSVFFTEEHTVFDLA